MYKVAEIKIQSLWFLSHQSTDWAEITFNSLLSLFLSQILSLLPFLFIFSSLPSFLSSTSSLSFALRSLSSLLPSFLTFSFSPLSSLYSLTPLSLLSLSLFLSLLICLSSLCSLLCSPLSPLFILSLSSLIPPPYQSIWTLTYRTHRCPDHPCPHTYTNKPDVTNHIDNLLAR